MPHIGFIGLGNHAADIYQEFCETGASGMDFSGIINFVRAQSGG